MIRYNMAALKSAMSLLSATIITCKKIQLKFSEETFQHSLLTNRIKALYISKGLLMGD